MLQVDRYSGLFLLLNRIRKSKTSPYTRIPLDTNDNRLLSFLLMCLGHPLVGVFLLYEKSVGICICYRSSVRGFSHCLIEVERQRRSPRLYMQSMRSAIFLPKYRAECKIITYPRASTVAQLLTSIGNFARISNNQESARINAFLCIFTTSRSA